MKTTFSTLVDPRGIQEQYILPLSKRPTMEELKKGPILFYNNTKLSFVNYNEVFVRTKERLTEVGITNYIDYVETVRGKSTKDLQDYAAMMAKEKPVAAIVALGDMGTSAATTIVSIALEELGIPTLYFTAPPGTSIVKSVAFYRATHLCITSLDIYQGSSVEDVRGQVDKEWDSVMDALLLPPGQIEQRADLGFVLDKDVQSNQGIIDLTDKLVLDAEDQQEPAAGIEAITELFDELRIGDGFPIVPPTTRRVKRMMSYCPYEPETVLAEQIGPSGKDITVQDVAVAAVMAGCKPQYMPILIASFKAMANQKYNFIQSVTTSHPGGNMVLVSGPLAKEIGIHGGQGCLGPGFAANMTIGRAMNLVIVNTCRSVPGVCDLACTSSQAEITYCFAEDADLTPWDTINAERFDEDTTTVYVLKAEPPHDIIDFLSLTAGDLLDTIVDCTTTLGSNNAYIPGPMVIVLTPDHSWLLEREGWTKDALREHIYARSYNETPLVRNRGLVPVRPKEFDNAHPMPVARKVSDIEIVVAGGRGGHSAVILPWALHSEAIVEKVVLPDGSIPKSIEDFRVK